MGLLLFPFHKRDTNNFYHKVNMQILILKLLGWSLKIDYSSPITTIQKLIITLFVCKKFMALLHLHIIQITRHFGSTYTNYKTYLELLESPDKYVCCIKYGHCFLGLSLVSNSGLFLSHLWKGVDDSAGGP